MAVQGTVGWPTSGLKLVCCAGCGYASGKNKNGRLFGLGSNVEKHA